MKTNKKPTLAEIKELIIDSLTKNILPKEKDALDFLIRVMDWQSKPEKSAIRRKIFSKLLNSYKKRSKHKDGISITNEMWATLKSIIPFYEKYIEILTRKPAKPRKKDQLSLFQNFSFSIASDVSFMNH